MKYLLRKDNEFEFKYRREYIEKITGIWFYRKCEIGKFIVLESMPSSYYSNICIVYGHNYEVGNFLSHNINELEEKEVFIVSCDLTNKELLHINDKNIYFAPQSNNRVLILDGKQFGFRFDITETELNIYNLKEKDIHKRLKTCFNIPNTIT